MAPAGAVGELELPDGVGLLESGEPLYFTQRQQGRPMVDCMFAALCTPLSYLGLRLPSDFSVDLRGASGVPDRDKSGELQGTTTAASQRAVKALFGDLPGLFFGTMTENEMLDGLAQGEFVVRVMSNTKFLPPHLKRWVGRSWNGGHAIAIGGARQVDGAWHVLWMDPAGRPQRGYAGEWVAFDDVKGSLKRSGGEVIVAVGEKDAVLDEVGTDTRGTTDPTDTSKTTDKTSTVDSKEGGVQLLTGGVPDQFAQVAAGTPFLHPTTLQRVTRASVGGVFRLAGKTVDGKYTGIWVQTKRVAGANGLTLLLVETALINEPFIRQATQ